jgi:hypothetical protein
LPKLDLEDLKSQQAGSKLDTNRQFAAVYSQDAYLATLREDAPILPANDKFWNLKHRISLDQRYNMIVVMEELTRLKGYRDLTFFCAAHIADSYVKSLSRSG